MNSFKKLILLISPVKLVKKIIICIIKKVVKRNNLINEIFTKMNNQELQDVLSKLLLNERLQQKVYDNFMKQIMNNDSIIDKLSHNEKFVDKVTHKESFISTYANRNQLVIIKTTPDHDHLNSKSVNMKSIIKKDARISILICTPNIYSEFTKKCISSIKKYTNDFTYELIFYENGKFHNFSHPRDINRALSTSLGDYFVTLDEDVEVTPHWLESLLMYAEPDVGVVGCMNLNSNPKYWNTLRSTGAWVDNEGNVHSYIKKITEPINTPFVSSSCILINTKNLKFNEKFLKYYQEVDFCYRIWESGQRVVVAPHSIYHYVQGTLQTLGFNRSQRIEMGNKDRDLFKKIWIETGRMKKLYNRIQPFIPFRIK